jgi:hypothetical protein
MFLPTPLDNFCGDISPMRIVRIFISVAQDIFSVDLFFLCVRPGYFSPYHLINFLWIFSPGNIISACFFLGIFLANTHLLRVSTFYHVTVLRMEAWDVKNWM